MNIIDEIWKDVPGYEGYYQVSDRGNVRSCDRYVNGSIAGVKNFRKGQILKLCLTRYGYLQVGLRKNSLSPRSVTVHILVMLAFVGDRPQDFDINHKNGIKTDNRLQNLEYCTAGENTRHAIELGLFKPGYSATLESIVKLVELHSQGLSDYSIAELIGCSRHVVYRARKRLDLKANCRKGWQPRD